MFKLENISHYEVEHYQEMSRGSRNSLLSHLLHSESGLGGSNSVLSSRRVTANIATQAHRLESLLATLESIRGQFDEIRIYLNGFLEVPPDLLGYTTHIGADLTDNGKFFWSHTPNEYYFTLDDDIWYPPDYVKKTLPLIRNRIISYHGKVLVGTGRGYIEKHKIYPYYEELRQGLVLDVMGTGVSAFDTEVFRPTLWQSPNFKMSDLVVSLEAQIRGIEIFSPAKAQNWIKREPSSLATITSSISWTSAPNDPLLGRWADAIYSLIGSRLQLSSLDYRFSEESAGVLASYIQRSQSPSVIFLRGGNGEFSQALAELMNGSILVCYDTEAKRVQKCKDFWPRGKVEYKWIGGYEDLVLNGGEFIFLDDLILPPRISSLVWDLMPRGYLICHNLVNGIPPESRLELELERGVIEYFYYYKKD